MDSKHSSVTCFLFLAKSLIFKLEYEFISMVIKTKFIGKFRGSLVAFIIQYRHRPIKQ